MSSKKTLSPRVSMFCSLYKGGPYIEHYLKDACRQTIFKECELVIVDANSPDGEEEHILEFQKSHKNVKYIKLDADPGLYACWNIAVKASSGAYLNNANVDDSKHPEALEIQADSLDQDREIDLVYADSLIVNQPNEPFERARPSSRYNFPDFSIPNLIRYNMPHQSPVYRRSLHDRFGFFDEKYRSASDWEFWLRCATGGSLMKKVNKVLGVYYFNPTGVSTNPDNEEWKQKEEAEIKNKYLKKCVN